MIISPLNSINFRTEHIYQYEYTSCHIDSYMYNFYVLKYTLGLIESCVQGVLKLL